MVHKQDWFIRERYRPATGEGDMSFLSRSYERHFNERPFLTHACFLYLTKTTRERMHMRSDFSTLLRGQHHSQRGEIGNRRQNSWRRRNSSSVF